MSCDHHRAAYFRQLGAAPGAVADTFGGAREAEAALEQIFNTARNQAALGDARQLKQAEAATQALFDRMAAAGHDMRHLHRTALPHRKAAWFGYAAVYQTLEAIRQRKPLPALASAILARRGQARTIRAVGQDARGYCRCASCGRFTSPGGAHLCPITADAAALNRALVRRLGVPATAYGQALAGLLAEARRSGGALAMRHALTGETAAVTLDGLPLALATGFFPAAWNGRATPVELADGRCVAVLDAAGLNPLQLPDGAVAAAGAAYGITVPAGAPVISAAGPLRAAEPAGAGAPEGRCGGDLAQPDPPSPAAGGWPPATPAQASHPAAGSESQGMTELRQAMAQMAQAVGTLAQFQGKAAAAPGEPSDGECCLREAADQLAAPLPGTTAQPGGAPRPGRCPRCRMPMEAGHACPPPAPPVARPLAAERALTPQEMIFQPVTLPAPDPYLLQVPAAIGGQLYQPLAENVPELDPGFELNAQAEKILRIMSTNLQLGAGKANSAWSRSFGVYGPPGTGKNTLARQLAAAVKTVDREGRVSQGLNYTEANITPESSMTELIGATVLETDPAGGATISRARLGKIGLAAALGSVICINEIVRSPKLATALQSMIEDGEIQIDSPEQGLIRIPVHPATVFVCTWNPGCEGDAERPAAAPLSRMIALRLDYPSLEEQAQRVNAFLDAVNGETGGAPGGERHAQAALARAYAVPARITASQEEILAATRFFNEVQRLAGGGVGEKMIGLNSATSTAPGPRELGRFVALGKTVGWEDALETLKITCDQDDQFASQWQLVRERFEAHFGADAEALQRQQDGRAPAAS